MQYSFFILIGIFIFFSSCFRDDLENIKVPVWNPDIAIPLINSHFTLEDIIAEFNNGGHLVTDSTGLIILVFNRDSIVHISAKEFFQIPDQSFSSTDTVQLIEFAFPGGELIHTLGVKEGGLILHMSSNREEIVNVNIDIPKATINGVPLHKELLFHTSEGIADTIDLSGYTLDLTGDGNDANVLKIQYDAQTVPDSLPVILEEFSGSLQNLSFNYADGFFGIKNFEINTDTIALQFLQNWIEGTIYINNPEISVTLQNYFGMPFFLELSNFRAENTTLTVPISGAVFTDSITINFPQDSLAENPVITDVAINSNNSNIENVISFTPQKITYQLLLSLNSPSENVPVSFLHDTSKLTGDVRLKLPFQGRIDDLVLQDTFDLAIDTIKELTHANFKLMVSNTFPVNAQMQIIFADTNFQPIDSLLMAPENIIASGITNASGEVITPTTQTTFIEFERKKLENLFSARKIIVRARLSAGSAEQPSIKLLSSYRIDLHLGVIAGVTRP